MARFTKLLRLVIIFAATGTGVAQILTTTAGPNDLSLTISAVHDTVAAGSPVFVRAVLTNKSDQNLSMSVMIGTMYTVDVHDAEGNTPPQTKFGFYHDRRIDVGRVVGDRPDWRYLNGSMLSVTRKPNESEIGDEDISRLYDLDQPGTYTIVLSLTGSLRVKSNPVTVTVVPAPAATSVLAPEQVPASAPFSLAISLNYAVKPGMPVDVDVVTKNVASHNIVLRRQEHTRDTGMLGSVFRIDVLDGQGNPPSDTPLGQSKSNRADTSPDPSSMAAARAAGTVVSLKPGQDWRNTLRVSDLYDLSKPGQYTIQVRRWDDETKTWVKSNIITVTVTP